MARRIPKNPSTAPSLEGLEQALGHTFVRQDLLTLALTHRSFVYDTSGPQSEGDRAARSNPALDNEQFEFLGDAALGLLVAEALFRRFPACREGELTRMRAALVSRKHLGEVGILLDLGRWLRLGPTTEEAGARTNAALISNALEAVIAALYLDGGLEVARRFVERCILPPLDTHGSQLPELSAVRDNKTTLQELVQAANLGKPRYLPVAEDGPDHRRIFHFQVTLEGAGAALGILAEGQGSTKKQAQQEAARDALTRLTAIQAEWKTPEQAP